MAPTRRQFMAASAVAATGTVLGPNPVRASANERLGVAVIGCGVRGNQLLDGCLRARDDLKLEFPVLCDVWRPNRERTAAKIEEQTGRRPDTCSRYADVLTRDDVDCVFITTPDFAHCPILADAARAGKHAYVEKPMGVDMKETRDACDAVLESGIICQVGTQRRSDGRYRAAARFMQSGALGTVVKCDTAWHDRGPRWRRAYDDVRQEDVDWEQYLMGLKRRPFDPRMYRCWHLYRDCTVGLVGLLGSHLIDVATWFCDDPLPAAATGMGGNIVWTERELYDTQECLYEYPKGFLLQYSSRLGNSNRPVAENVFYGTRGTFDTSSWTATGDGGGADRIENPVVIDAEPSTGHITNWVQCIRAGNPATNADIHTGYAHTVASIMGTLACESGRRMVYDHKRRGMAKG